jgi:hypothetical protein
VAVSEPVHPRLADTDRNLLFGVLALQADFLDASRFAQACAAWAAAAMRTPAWPLPSTPKRVAPCR